MNIELERQVMDSLILAGLIHVRLYFRFNEIAALSFVKKSTLQRVLARLVKRVWIKKIVTHSYSALKPIGKVGYLRNFREPYYKSIPKEAQGLILFPEEPVNKFIEELPKLKRKKRFMTIDSNQIQIEEESFANHLDNIEHPNKRDKVFRNGSFKGRTKLWRKCIKSEMPPQFTFYKLIEYPYWHRIRGGYMKAEVNEKLVPEWNVDDGTEEYWRDAAKEGQLISKEWHEIIPRIDMRKRILQHFNTS